MQLPPHRSLDRLRRRRRFPSAHRSDIEGHACWDVHREFRLPDNDYFIWRLKGSAQAKEGRRLYRLTLKTVPLDDSVLGDSGPASTVFYDRPTVVTGSLLLKRQSAWSFRAIPGRVDPPVEGESFILSWTAPTRRGVRCCPVAEVGGALLGDSRRPHWPGGQGRFRGRGALNALRLMVLVLASVGLLAGCGGTPSPTTVVVQEPVDPVKADLTAALRPEAGEAEIRRLTEEVVQLPDVKQTDDYGARTLRVVFEDADAAERERTS